MPCRTLRPLPFSPWLASVASASTPPSPLLSARMIRVTYLIVTVSVTAQNSVDRTPSTCAGVTAPCRFRAGQDFAKRVYRAGADVAEHHAQRAHDQSSGGGLGIGRGRDVGGDGRWSKGGRGHDIERRQGWRRRDGLRPRLPPVNAPNRAQLRRKRLTWNRPGGGLGRMAGHAPQHADVSDPGLYQADTWRPLFARLRREAPVHHCREQAATAPTGR